MTKLIFLKAIIGSSVLVGSATTGTYFGSKITVEQYINKEGNLIKAVSADNWTKNLEKIKKEPSLNTETKPKSNSFVGIKNGNDKKWTDLEKLCEEELNKVHKVFWKEILKVEKNLETDLKEYCFINFQS